MPRADRILAGLEIDRLVGLEIGPLDRPLVRRAPGRRVFYGDYADRDSLRARSSGDPHVDTDAICPVDFIISPLPETLPERFDYIIASHVAEHVPDLIGWLKTLGGWLNDGGRIVLALPDKRFTFDCQRELSTTGQLIEAHVTGRQRPAVAAIYDGFSRAVRADAWYLWEGVAPPAPFERMFSDAVALDFARAAHASGEYRDCHCWVFTCDSFRAMLEEVRALGLIAFTWERFEPTARYEIEFFVSLQMA